MSKARIYAEQFRKLAKRFEEEAARAERGTAVSRPTAVAQIESLNDAGELVVAAWRAGYLRQVAGLAEWIEWLEGGESPAGWSDRFKRCAANVFFQLAGGIVVTVRVPSEPDGDPEVLSDPEGGLLAALEPALYRPRPFLRTSTRASGDERGEFRRLEEADNWRRRARTCEVLEDLLNDDQQQTGADIRAVEGMLPAGCDDSAIDVLKYLAEQPGVAKAMADVSAAANRDRKTLRPGVQALVEAGLVRWDRRKMSITETGLDWVRRYA